MNGEGRSPLPATCRAKPARLSRAGFFSFGRLPPDGDFPFQRYGLHAEKFACLAVKCACRLHCSNCFRGL